MEAESASSKRRREDEDDVILSDKTSLDNIETSFDADITRLTKVISACKITTSRQSEMIDIVSRLQATFRKSLINRRVSQQTADIANALTDVQSALQSVTAKLSTTDAAHPASVSYAQAARTKLVENVKVPSGKSVAPVPRSTVVIVPKPDSPLKTANETKTTLMKVLDPQRYVLRLDRVTKTGKSSIRLESEKSNLTKIPAAILDQGGLVIKPQDKSFPRISILDVPRNLSPEQVKEALVSQNFHDASDQVLHVANEHLKVLFRFGNREGANCNWILEVHPEVQRYLLASRRVYVAWNACRVNDHIRVTRCFNCQKYGHHSTNCKSDIQCGHCAEKHETKTCPNPDRDPTCANCVRFGHKGNVVKHKATSNTCPAYLKRLDAKISNTDYEL
ncbi:hypothetical protein RN001_012995 [Aquatica leii]|uniref:CCHC-type domain-containing protein n=1 Tax=Aquatica leii TaxID=1421715 RepID=A0AAN7PZJ2_9COLE|nr:hypothetical protein RN001_012995 [Aquatica leii]